MPETLDAMLTKIDRQRPLLLVDADEVLLRFVERLEAYFLSEGFELRLDSFQLSGNTYHMESGEKADPTQMKQLMGGFFHACVDDMQAVDGAADALMDLSEHFQIAVLSNVPSSCRERREQNLHALGLAYPVIANKGNKGPAVQQLAQATDKMTVFIDDLPPQHSSVAEHAPDCHRIHFIADPRLAKMIGKAPDAHVRLDTWPDVAVHLMKTLEQ